MIAIDGNFHRINEVVYDIKSGGYTSAATLIVKRQICGQWPGGEQAVAEAKEWTGVADLEFAPVPPERRI